MLYNIFLDLYQFSDCYTSPKTAKMNITQGWQPAKSDRMAEKEPHPPNREAALIPYLYIRKPLLLGRLSQCSHQEVIELSYRRNVSTLVGRMGRTQSGAERNHVKVLIGSPDDAAL